jgi:hypothetical protein
MRLVGRGCGEPDEAYVKTLAAGALHGVSEKHVQRYLDEFV